MRVSKKLLAGLAVLAFVGLSGLAFAHSELGYRGHHMGYGDHMRMGYGSHMGYGDYGRYSGLTDEKVKSLDKARNDFFNTTRKLRNNIFQKQLELRSELARQEPDSGKAKDIQKELSGLEAKFDRKHLEHKLEINNIAPKFNRGFAGRGFGQGSRGYCLE
jgi:zinc resistance-associated protein